MAKNQKYSDIRGKGLFIKTYGGRPAWLFRRFFPDVATWLHLAHIRLKKAENIRKQIDLANAKENPPLFTNVEIETQNRCNGECSFCPVNRRDDPRPHSRMSESLFSSLMDQFSELGFSGILSLYSNNEPLIDTRLEAFAAEARRKVPEAFLNISTNGSLLTLDRFRNLIPHFDRMIVNNYADGPELRDEIRELCDFCRGPEGAALIEGKTIEVRLRRRADVLTNRAGNAPNRQDTPVAAPLSIPCYMPFYQLIIRPDGKVSLCCNDALGQETLGDLSRETLTESWYGEIRRRAQNAMAEHGRAGLALCSRCDFV